MDGRAHDELLDTVAGWIAGADRVLPFTGAGISTESGIPDFRGPNGVWTRTDPARYTIQNFLADPEVRRERWLDRLASPIDTAQPNRGHRALVELERMGKVDVLVTQNIDGLHQRAGSRRVIELHGTTREATCLSCHVRLPIARVLSRVEEGDTDPRCERCDGLLKTATISFGQSMVEEDVELAMAAARECDVCLAVGSTLAVWPAAGVPLVAAKEGARLVIVNDGETELDRVASAIVRGRAGTILPALVAAVRRLQGSRARGA